MGLSSRVDPVAQTFQKITFGLGDKIVLGFLDKVELMNSECGLRSMMRRRGGCDDSPPDGPYDSRHSQLETIPTVQSKALKLQNHHSLLNNSEDSFYEVT